MSKSTPPGVQGGSGGAILSAAELEFIRQDSWMSRERQDSLLDSNVALRALCSRLLAEVKGNAFESTLEDDGVWRSGCAYCECDSGDPHDSDCLIAVAESVLQ